MHPHCQPSVLCRQMTSVLNIRSAGTVLKKGEETSLGFLSKCSRQNSSHLRSLVFHSDFSRLPTTMFIPNISSHSLPTGREQDNSILLEKQRPSNFVPGGIGRVRKVMRLFQWLTSLHHHNDGSKGSFGRVLRVQILALPFISHVTLDKILDLCLLPHLHV